MSVHASEHAAPRRELQRLNRILRTVSAGNEMLVRVDSETALLHGMCQVVVDGGYPTAWIGYAEHDAAKTVRPVAWAGSAAQNIQFALCSWGDSEYGHGPTGTAIRTGQPQIIQDVSTSECMQIWRDAAMQRGLLSVAAFPLHGSDGVFGAFCIYARTTETFDEPELRLLTELSNDLAFGIKAQRDHLAAQMHAQRLQQTLEATVQALAIAVEHRDPYTAGHQRNVAALAAAIAREIGLPKDDVAGIYLAGMIHDIGKIQAPAEILSKAGRLTTIEYQLLQTHPQVGFDIVKSVDFPWPVATMILQHHERLDGSGYPEHLRGEQIILGARILAVADVVEAMTARRPYREALGLDVALHEIEQGHGRLYDPACVDACIRLFRERRFSFKHVTPER
ncbi:MAG TPA: HD domain-containing phosphohydrolase [Acetobacteraceae bacterium]|nr:HD domain-containing phosphohydrolase [Acetobacteraceae bacterium]